MMLLWIESPFCEATSVDALGEIVFSRNKKAVPLRLLSALGFRVIFKAKQAAQQCAKPLSVHNIHFLVTRQDKLGPLGFPLDARDVAHVEAVWKKVVIKIFMRGFVG